MTDFHDLFHRTESKFIFKQFSLSMSLSVLFVKSKKVNTSAFKSFCRRLLLNVMTVLKRGFVPVSTGTSMSVPGIDQHRLPAPGLMEKQNLR